jgi:hypothetical protein
MHSAEFVISADEKTSIQARCRCHPTLPPARVMRLEHEYVTVRPSGLALVAESWTSRLRVRIRQPVAA